jgi:8-oxo-dGTP pyrophosphatase MutT (NUDIX family)
MSVRFLHGDAPRGGSLDDAVAEVQRALCVGPEAVEAKKRILDFVAAHHEALHRTCLSGHLTGSALVIDAERERTLVLMHAKLGKWLQPGGHADCEGHLATVALDEAEEETGIEGLAVAGPAVDCDVHVIPERPGEPEHVHLDVRYIVSAPDDAVVIGNHESDALKWVTLGELEEIAGDPSLARLARAGFALVHELG